MDYAIKKTEMASVPEVRNYDKNRKKPILKSHLLATKRIWLVPAQ